MANKGFGWRAQNPDQRDHAFKLSHRLELLPESQLPTTVDHRAEFPPPYDQGQLSACGPNALAGLLESFFIKTKYPFQHTPSRLFMYWNTRVLMGTTLEDSGVDNRTLIQAVSATGECPESQPSGKVEDWYVPYSDDQIHFRMPPGSRSKTDAKLHLIQKYEWVDLNRASVLNALASGLDFMVGFTVYDSFMNIGADGAMPIPAASEGVQGGHDIAVVGYLLNTPKGNQGVIDWAICRNSWGTSFGDGGYFFMPIDDVLCNSAMTQDAVTVTFVGHVAAP